MINHNKLRSHLLSCLDMAKGQDSETVHSLWLSVEEVEVVYQLLVQHSSTYGCLGYPECDGDLVATPHTAPCPLTVINQGQ